MSYNILNVCVGFVEWWRQKEKYKNIQGLLNYKKKKEPGENLLCARLCAWLIWAPVSTQLLCTARLHSTWQASTRYTWSQTAQNTRLLQTSSHIPPSSSLPHFAHSFRGLTVKGVIMGVYWQFLDPNAVWWRGEKYKMMLKMSNIFN